MTKRYTLPNGLTVVVDPQHRAPVVAIQVWVKVGSADETPDEIGLAHLHEHMLFKGTAKRGIGEIARSIEASGGEINAWTSFDQTVYHVVIASRHLRDGLDVLSDAVRSSRFDENELSSEIEVVCEEIKRSLDMPSRRASAALFAHAFRVHPYGRPVIGYAENVRSHTRARVISFYQKHYCPSNMVLSVVGDFDEDQLEALVHEYFGGDFGQRDRNQPTRPVEPAFSGCRVSLTQSEIKEAYLHLAFQIPGVEHPATAALDVLAMLVGQGDSSRLSIEVKRKRSLAKDVSTWAWTPREPGLFAASIVCSADQAKAAFAQTLAVLAAVKAAPVPIDELETVKSLIEAEAVYQRETMQGLARKLGYYEAVGGGLEREAKYYESIAAVTAAQLQAVAQEYLTFERLVVSGLLPPESDLTEAAIAEMVSQVAKTTAIPLPPQHLPNTHQTARRPQSKSTRRSLVSHQLANGVTVVVQEEHSVPIVAFRAAFAGGLRFETTMNNGLTSLLARTMTRGTTSIDAEQISHLVDRLAGSMSAMAGRSSMTLRGDFLSKYFKDGSELFADVLLHPAFSDGEFKREKMLQLHDIAARDDRPSSVVFDLFAKTLYATHPYRLSSLGEKQSVSNIQAADLHDYHGRFLNPADMTLAVVGDVETDEVLAYAEKYFSAKSEPSTSVAAIAAEPPWNGARRAERHLAKAQCHLVYGFPGAKVSDSWRRALEVMQTLLSGQSGRLFLELRDKRSMAYSVSAMVVEGVDPGYFGVYMATSPEKVNNAVDGIRNELLKLTEISVSDGELLRAKQHLIGTHEIGLQRNSARAATMALDTCYGLGADRFMRYAEEISAVTPDSIVEVARRVINFDRSVLAVVGPSIDVATTA